MKALLFCQYPYAFDILEPICTELLRKNHDVLWFITKNLRSNYPFSDKYPYTGNMKDAQQFGSDAIFAPGNEVPHYLTGVKVQIFHGFAGEKKGHFRIRNYFDLYLTQGPYFTKRFSELALKYKDFRVIETGWSKLDRLYRKEPEDTELRDRIRKKIGSAKVILYAPTFSPSLTSAGNSHDEIISLTDNKDLFLIVKFHDLTDPGIIDMYKKSLERIENGELITQRNILHSILAADLMISDTSSAVYEFLLMNKPVITIKSGSDHIRWTNIRKVSELKKTVANVLEKDPGADQRKWFMDNYHPYNDGLSSVRMIEATENFIEEFGIPEKRKLNLYGRLKIKRLFGKT